ncbi:hypothetical protein TWF481_005205 [Arthrobotrys musiformis]|uniref:CUE domain-containing protein n=1 Tax=Arthrobotrys musiformis TaxID=47236 RepID=A0AAV9WD03_9PEZI
MRPSVAEPHSRVPTIEVSSIFFGLTVLLATTAASPAMRRAAAAADLRIRQEEAASDEKTAIAADGTAIKMKSSIKETIIAQIPRLPDITDEVAEFLRNFPDSGYEQIAKMGEPQMTEAITSLLAGQIPAGVTAEKKKF